MGSRWAMAAWDSGPCGPGGTCLAQTIRDSLSPVAIRFSISALIGLLIGALVWSVAVHLHRS